MTQSRTVHTIVQIPLHMYTVSVTPPRKYDTDVYTRISDLVTFHSNKYLAVEGVKIGSGI